MNETSVVMLMIINIIPTTIFGFILYHFVFDVKNFFGIEYYKFLGLTFLFYIIFTILMIIIINKRTKKEKESFET